MTALIVAAATLSVGCAPGQRQPSTAIEIGYRQHGDADARGSLVIPTRTVQRSREASEEDARLPWFASRNDARLGVEAGVQSATYEQVATFTTDHQAIHGDHVHDYYNDRTYRTRVFETVR